MLLVVCVEVTEGLKLKIVLIQMFGILIKQSIPTVCTRNELLNRCGEVYDG